MPCIPSIPPLVGGAAVTIQQPPQMPMQMPMQQPPPQPPAGPPFTEDDVNQVKEMFPNVEEEVIKSLFEANRGNKDLTINNLLAISS